MAAARKNVSSPPHKAPWVLAVAGTLVATAVIQGVRSWIDVDAYDHEVEQRVAPVEEAANEARQSVQQLQVDLAALGLEAQDVNLSKEIYRLENERDADPKQWKLRDEERVRELRDKLEKTRRSLEQLQEKQLLLGESQGRP